jgi:transcriptional regulator with XRE-family HTH domain
MNRRKELELLGSRLRTARQNARYNRKQLAALVGIGHQAIYLYENAAREPSKEIIKKIAEITEVSIAYLMGETDDPRPLSEWRLSESERIASPAASKKPAEGADLKIELKNLKDEIKHLTKNVHKTSQNVEQLLQILAKTKTSKPKSRNIKS